jgi:lysophospholipase L1-like esterase
MSRINTTPFGRLVLVAAMLSCLCATAQAQWRYTAMGDSIATAYTVTAGGGYVPRYQGYIQSDTGSGVTLYNLGQNGWTSGRLLGALRMDPVFQSAVVQSEVVMWNVGINDMMSARNSYKNRKCGGTDNQDCLRSMVATFKANWDGLVGEVLVRRTTGDTIIRTMDIYNPWVKADRAKNTTADKSEGAVRGNDFQVIKYYLDQMNAHVAASAAAHFIPCAQVHAAFNGASGDEDPIAKGLIGSDGLHPTDAGHKLIADLLRGLGYAPLR